MTTWVLQIPLDEGVPSHHHGVLGVLCLGNDLLFLLRVGHGCNVGVLPGASILQVAQVSVIVGDILFLPYPSVWWCRWREPRVWWLVRIRY